MYRMMTGLALLLAALPAPGAQAQARDSLGVYEEWGAFRDSEIPRCYAISAASNLTGGRSAFVSVGTWPRRDVRGQVHFRLSRAVAPSTAITLRIGRQSFRLAGGGSDAWAQDARMDAAIVAAMRAAGAMSLSARDAGGRGFTDRYLLAGAATAMDAATVGCSGRGRS